MAGFTIPTTFQLAAAYKAGFETNLNQATPAADKAFNTVLATIEAMGDTVAYKFAADRAAANLWISAQGGDLDQLGLEWNLPRFQPVAWMGTVSLAANDGTIIDIGTIFTADSNGLQYSVTASVTAPYPGGTGTGVVLTIQAALETGQGGTSSNLSNGSTLSIQSPIAGAKTVATVTSTTITGTDQETDPAYRVRGLSLVQTLPNGSNAASFRLWAQSVAGVAQAYPYAGSAIGTPYPGMRTVYIECTPDINLDGITPGTWDENTQTGTGLLAQVAQAIITNPDTGVENQDLGLVVSTLYVKPIRRTPVYVQITGGAALSAVIQSAITAALTTYMAQISPFVSGVDPLFARNDTVTTTLLSAVIQAVLSNYGVFVQGVGFGTIVGTFLLAYQLSRGEKVKLGGVSFV
jgi:hypothetical protein